MKLDIPPIIQKHLQLPAKLDTDALNPQQLEKLHQNLHGLADNADKLVGEDQREEFQEIIIGLTSQILEVILAANANNNNSGNKGKKGKVAIPHLGKIQKLRGNFGKEVHDQMHLKPTDSKSHHGVWLGNPQQVRKWVTLAVDSIYSGDEFVVDSKPAKNGHAYLVNMDQTTVGYLSGSSVPDRPKVHYIELYVNRKGAMVSAFPSDPSIF